MTVEADLFSRVSTYAGFVSVAGTRLYDTEAPQNVTEPYATFFLAGDKREHLMGGDAGVVWGRYQFDAWGATPTSARAVREQIRLALSRYSGTGTVTITDILIEQGMDHPKEHDSKTFHSSLDAIVIYRE